ncbi:unnamed protein product [Linum trigynum]|uniref:Uncharacterized protein n=1 Tax=Linum trigynum TaxID=586398 RepID=A0AAV2FRS7_9ROSI
MEKKAKADSDTEFILRRMDSCFWTLIGTSPSSSWPPMVLKINLGHLGTLARHFLSLGTDLSLKNSNPPSVWLKICLKRHQPKHGRGHGRVMPQPARALASVNYTSSSGEKHGRASLWTRPCNA